MSHKGKSALIADDSPTQLQYLTNVLRGWGLTTDIAYNGNEALEMIENKDYDYLLIDWRMPMMDGLSLLAHLQKQHKDLSNVIMMSAYEKSKLLSQAGDKRVKLGKILQKPYSFATLYETLFDKKLHNTQSSMFERTKLAKSFKALLAEDNETNQIVGKKILEKVGFEVDVAFNGEMAHKMAKESAYDIIVMDLEMPIMDGFEATRQIRQFAPKIPIFALSASVSQGDIDKALFSGMNGHLAKPIDMLELEKVLMQYFPTSFNDANNSNPELSVAIEGINIEAIRTLLEITPDEIYQLLKQFAYNQEATLEKLKVLRAKDIELPDVIHKLKGASGNLSIMNVYNAAIALEHTQDETQRESRKEQLTQELEKAIARIHQALPDETLQINHASISKESFLRMLDYAIEKIESSVYLPPADVHAISSYVNYLISQEDAASIEEHYNAFNLRQLLELFHNIKTNAQKGA